MFNAIWEGFRRKTTRFTVLMGSYKRLTTLKVSEFRFTVLTAVRNSEGIGITFTVLVKVTI